MNNLNLNLLLRKGKRFAEEVKSWDGWIIRSAYLLKSDWSNSRHHRNNENEDKLFRYRQKKDWGKLYLPAVENRDVSSPGDFEDGTQRTISHRNLEVTVIWPEYLIFWRVTWHNVVQVSNHVISVNDLCLWLNIKN